ncbi:zinc ribbon domain-containing protein [Gynuella sunshinyii]|uniref:Putative zinc ribbon domain-containing protein n=1 Tax=Gynuella sunshinyii YC6258 TaxID=1445510 RepID=A0A0C5VGF8_9GAMM|nr:zinc ribbon domain-containing protein [Gynuella sunshinyii]AJQ93687.1 hypothetical Protein YC6258_01639 [Gynuella sunshinyii YC6258]
MSEHRCESCGMPIDDGQFCQYCVDEQGQLQPFEERFERMVQWALSERSDLSRPEAEEQTRQYMRTMPAWKHHPHLQ